MRESRSAFSRTIGMMMSMSSPSLQLPLVAKAMKPLPFGYRTALRRIDARKDQAVAVGDQLFTDIVGAHLAGVKAFMVAPLAEVDLKHTLMLRGLEKRLIGAREPEPATACGFDPAIANEPRPVLTQNAGSFPACEPDPVVAYASDEVIIEEFQR